MNSPVKESKTAKVLCFPIGISQAGDPSDTNSEEIESPTKEQKSSAKKFPSSPSVEIPPDWDVRQPILTPEVLDDLEHMASTPLGEKYKTEYNACKNMKSRLKAKSKKLNDELVPAEEFVEFRSFLRHTGVNPYPHMKWSFHRKDNDNLNYGPGLAEYVSPEVQNNNKGDSIKLTIGDVTMGPKGWAEKTGIKENSIRNRWRRRKKGEKNYTDYEVVYGEVNIPKPLANDVAMGCTLKSPGPLAKPSDKISPSPFIPPASDPYTDLFKTEVEGVYGEKVVGMTEPHKFMLRRVASEISDAGVPEFEATKFVIRNWPEFTAYADDHYGIFNPPLKPTPEYMTRAVRAIPGFYNVYYNNFMKVRKENDPKVWSKLLRGYGKKIRKQAEKEYMEKRRKTAGVFESRAVWLHHHALACYSTLEQDLSINWGCVDPDKLYQYERWCKVIKRTSAMLGFHFQH